MLDLDHILCPVDPADFQTAAIDYSSRLARSTGATLHFLFVETSLVPYGIGMTGGGPVTVDARHTDFDKVQPTVAGVRFRKHVGLGLPAATCVSFASEQDMDVIVIGSHGRQGVSRLLAGSVAEEVIRTATVPVITVKIPAIKEEAPLPADFGSVAFEY